MPGQIRRRTTTDGKQGNPQAIFQRAHPTKPGKRLTQTRTFGTVKEARSWLAEMTVKYDRDPHARPDRAKTTFDELVKQWKTANAHGWSQRTSQRYEQILRTHLEPAFGSERVSAITRERVRDFLAQLAGTRKPDKHPGGRKNPHAGRAYAPGTIHKAHTVLSSIMAEAVERRMVSTNPCHGLNPGGKFLQPERTKELVVLSEDEVHKLADAIAALPHPKQPYAPNRMLILAAAYTGLRASELHALRRRDVDLEGGVVHVRRALKGWDDNGHPVFGDPKTRESKRTVDLADDIARLLADHFAGEPGGPDDLVFTNSDRGVIRQSSFMNKHFGPARELALPDHPDYTFHDLRHCFVSWLLAAGVDLMTVAKQAGHANPAITAKVYAHAMPSTGSKVKAAFKSRTGNVIEVDFKKVG
jgi:integrase